MPVSYVDLLVVLILGAWFIASVLAQFSFKWFERVSARDVFLLLPLWTFFAPNPGRSDYHVVYRDRRANGSMSEWQEVEVTDARRPYSWLWNPEKRSKKVLSDLVAAIHSSIREERASEAEIMLSLPYLLLLNIIYHIGKAPDTTHRQFIILETFGFKPTAGPRVILRSDFHAM